MRVREKLLRTHNRYLLVTFAGIFTWGALVLGVWATTRGHAPTWLFQVAIPVFCVILFGILGSNFLVRCPKCRGNLSRIGPLSSRPWFGRRPVTHCPFCGLSLDATVAP